MNALFLLSYPAPGIPLCLTSINFEVKNFSSVMEVVGDGEIK
jgi:hypothetical protein